MSQRTIVKLNDFISVSKPADDANLLAISSAEHGPSFVIILGWMDANSVHIMKYSSAYEKLWPASTHIIRGSHSEVDSHSIRRSILVDSAHCERTASILEKENRDSESAESTPKVDSPIRVDSAESTRIDRFRFSQNRPNPFTVTSPIVQQSFWGLIFSSLETRTNELAPILTVFKEANIDFADPSSSRGIALHAFSNGGLSRLIRLEALLRRVAKGLQPRRRAPVALILDSNPANPHFRLLFQAITTGWRLPLKLAFALVFTPCYFFLRVFEWVSGRTNPAVALRQRLARTDLLAPWTMPATPRTHIYSSADAVVPAEGIEAHIADVRRLGIEVHAERYTDSSHVAHARSDPDRYWRVVSETWARACAVNEDQNRRIA